MDGSGSRSAPPSGDRDRDRLGGCDHAVEHLDGDGHLALDVLRRAREERWSFLDSVLNGVYTVPGDGAIDSVAAPEPLAEAGYSGWLICEAEQNPSKAHPLTYARRGYATLKATVEQVGLKLA